jgi:aconitate hydratase
MAIKKKRRAERAARKRAGRKRTAAKRAAPKRRSSATRRRATGRQSTSKKGVSKSTTVRRKERKVDEARHKLIEAEKELAVEELPKKVHPATNKRGADSHVPSKIKRKRPENPKEKKLEQGLEESMAGSDPVSVTQPVTPIAEKLENSPDDDSETNA